MTLSWLLAAAGAGARLAASARPDPARASTAAPPRRRELSPRALAAGILAAALGCACVALLGPTVGLPAAALAVPAGRHPAALLASTPARRRADPAVPLALDLLAVALRAGQPVERALLAAAPAAGDVRRSR